ncbi:MAG: N-acetylmuramoyl-L-alanine amidase [Chitinivibrionales bacterium]|nr:N-acetylmuramoyl-L-alanine amidase [Chitinivibrionales bacterium]
MMTLAGWFRGGRKHFLCRSCLWRVCVVVIMMVLCSLSTEAQQSKKKPVSVKKTIRADTLFARDSVDTPTEDREESTTAENEEELQELFQDSALQKEDNPLQPQQGSAGAKQSRMGIKVIVIDPGHGGKDPGAVGPAGGKEKDITLAISLALAKEVRRRCLCTVLLTRTKDTFIPLNERTQFANMKKADLFISIHTNSIAGEKKRKGTINGYKVYFLSQASSEDDNRAAMIENSVIAMEDSSRRGDKLNTILLDMANSEFLTESQELSIIISEHFRDGLKQVRSLDKGVGQANFWVLNGAYMPAVLVEVGFISNPQEEKILTDKAFHEKTGKTLADAVMLFKKKFEAGL